MRSVFQAVSAIALLLGVLGTANAAIITMENGDRFSNHGFTKSTGIEDALFANPYNGTSGYDLVLTSGNYVGYQHQDGASISIGGSGTFTFNGAWWTSAWDPTNQLTLRGYLDGALIYQTTTTINNVTKTWIQSDFVGIDQLTVTSSGSQVAFDNWTYNESVTATPEPASCVIWSALGIAGLVAARRRRKLAAE